MDNLTVIIPFWNGHKTISELLRTLPDDLPVIVVDDQSDAPYKPNTKNKNVTVIYSKQKGYFTGAVNLGISACKTDVLILNQDVTFTSNKWMETIAENREKFGLIGESIGGIHPAWEKGYIHGTFMFIRRDVIDKVGLLNAKIYPLWGSTCEYQLRAYRQGFHALQVKDVQGFVHKRGKRAWGDSITEMLNRRPDDRRLFLRTPPEVSVIIPCYKQGRFLNDAINSLIGGETSLGYFKPQTFQSFEVIIVDDQSPDETSTIGPKLANPLKGIHYIRRKTNGGTPAANNTGILAAHGRFVTILCADDMMETNRLQTLYEAAITDPAKVYYDDMQTFTDGVRQSVMHMREYSFDRLIYKNFMHAGIFFEREAWYQVNGYPQIMTGGREDWAMAVRLGVHGFCGKHISNPGYLYRRQDHNRTLTNTTPSHHAKFLSQIQSLYPNVYNGERPPMCCGQSVKTSKSVTSSARRTVLVPMSAGSVVLEYIGTSVGTQTFYGPITGARYVAGKTRPLVSVDPRDTRTTSQTKRGLLDLMEGGKLLFRKYVPPVVHEEPLPEKPVSMETEDKETTPEVIESVIADWKQGQEEEEQKTVISAPQIVEEEISTTDEKPATKRRSKKSKASE